MCPDEVPPRPVRAHSAQFVETVDPDVEPVDRGPRAPTVPRQWDLLLAVSVGGVVGAEARYGIASALPRVGERFPWATLLTNIVGCLLIGVLMVLVLDVLRPIRLLRPFLGVGVLGGFTTFSTFGVETVELLDDGRVAIAILYVMASVLACAAAVWVAIAVTTRLAGRAQGESVVSAEAGA